MSWKEWVALLLGLGGATLLFAGATFCYLMRLFAL